MRRKKLALWLLSAALLACSAAYLGFTAAVPARGQAVFSIATNDIGIAYLGQPYEAQLAALGGSAPYSWRMNSGLLPPGVNLDARSGRIFGKPLQPGTYTFALAAVDGIGRVGANTFTLEVAGPMLDSYGGIISVPCSGGPQPHFYTEKIDNRWWLCTPAGNGFFMKGVYHVDYNDSGADYQDVSLESIINKKYAIGPTNSPLLNWSLQSVRRMQSWGFNTICEYGSAFTWPVFQDSRWGTPDNTIPVKMPYIILIRPSWYSFYNQNKFASEAVKDMVYGIKRSVFPHYRSHSVDFWDPKFAQWLQTALAQDFVIHQGFSGPNSDYLVGFDIDETDNLQGFGAGPDFPTADISLSGVIEDHTNPHIGWMVLVTAPTQSSNSDFKVTYSDTKVYSKAELSNWLSERYGGDITSLNNAWGSTYTTFGSNGGWGVGNGLLDEDGTCPAKVTFCWAPTDPYGLKGPSNALRQDLDDFLLHHMNKYYSIIKSTMQAQAPGILLLGSSPIGSWGSPPRKQLLQAAAPYLDVFTFGNIPTFICSDCNDIQQRIDFAAEHGGDKPWVNWEGFQAKADSYWNIAATSTDAVRTQAQRGVLYQQMMNELINARDSSGIYHVVGFQWWEFYDNRGEQANWGLITRRDNAYDGVQVRSAVGADQWGYPTGGELRPYGNFISAVRAANLNAVNSLANAAVTSTLAPEGQSARKRPATNHKARLQH